MGSAAVVFVLVMAGTLVAARRAFTWRSRALERLAPKPAAAALAVPSPAMVWRELVDRLGSAVAAAAKDLPRLKRRVVRAGFGEQAAARGFQGAGAALTVA